MKRTQLIIFLVLIFNLAIILNDVDAKPRILGIQAQDGSAIQVYDESNRYRDFYYPQDCEGIIDCLLTVDYFFIYIDFLDFDDTPRNFTISIYQSESRIITEQITSENGTLVQTIEKNVTDYTKLVDTKEFTVNKGDNEDRDTRYAIKRIDSSVLADLKASDDKELIRITYLDLEIKFLHKTDYSSVPITETRQEKFTFVALQLLWFAFAVFMGSYIGGWITGKVNHIYPPIPISSIMILFLLGIISWLVNMVLAVSSGADTSSLQLFGGIQPEYISLALAGGIAIYTPSRFRNKSTGKVLLLKLNIPYEDRKDILEKLTGVEFSESREVLTQIVPNGKWLDLHYYHTWRRDKIYTENPDSFFGFFTALIFKGINIKWQTTMRVQAGEKNLDEIMIVEDFKKSTDSIIPEEKARQIIGGFVISTIVWLVVAYLFNDLAFIPIIIITVGIVLFMYNKTENRLTININPLRRNATAAILDAKVANKIEDSYDEAIVENVDLKRNAKFEIIRRENTARLESFLVFASVHAQEEFANEMPEYVKILSAVGLDIKDQGKIVRDEQDKTDEELKALKDEE